VIPSAGIACGGLHLRKTPSALALVNIDAPLVMAFLDEMERARGITARTRNLRLTAVHSFFRFAAFEAPTHSAQIQHVLAILAKRFARAGAFPQPSWLRRISETGRGAVITHCCCWLCRPG